MSTRVTPILMLIVLSISLLFGGTQLQAGVSSYAIRELTELLLRTWGKEVAEVGAETLSRKVTHFTLRFGDDGLVALRRVGPAALHLADDLGEHAPLDVRLMPRHVDDAVRIISRPQSLQLVGRLGKDCAESLLRNGSVVEPLLEQHGTVAAKALTQVGRQNGRRLVMLADEAVTSPDRLKRVAAGGDEVCSFVWRNKAVLASTAVLAVFMANPEPFLDGSQELAAVATRDLAAPVALKVTDSLPWTPITVSVLACLTAVLTGRRLAIAQFFQKRRQVAAQETSHSDEST